MKNNSKLELIAELAQGFEGSFLQAKLLINAAASAGADVAKFQLIYADELATPDYKYYNLFKTLEMTDDEWGLLDSYASEKKIALYLDIFGTKGLYLCEKLGIKGIKLHGTDIANVGLLHAVKDSKLEKVYLGAGGAYLREIEQAIEILKDKEVNVLLGFQSYPTTTEDNQIERVRILKQYLNEKFSNCNVGFADHENPNTPLKYCLASCAIGAGANIIEKHLTLGKAMLMEDHESALNPDEFLEFTDIMRKCFKGLGVSNISDDFGMSLAEKDYRKMIRRHVVASRDLTIGTVLQPDDVILKRTASEDFITNINDVYSKKLKIAIKVNSAINYSIIQ